MSHKPKITSKIIKNIFLPDMSLLPKDFDYKAYISLNEDLSKMNIVDKDSACDHYVLFGRHENRRYKKEPLFDIDKDFDENFYITEYPDVAKYYINQTQMTLRERLFHHYTHYGKAEGRFKNQIQLINNLSSAPITINIQNAGEILYNPTNKLDAICLLTTNKEITDKRLHKFIKYLTTTIETNNNFTKKLDLNIIVNNLNKRLCFQGLKKYFKNVNVHNLQLNPKEDVYLTSLNNKHKLSKYGLKSGPNIVFFKTMELCQKYNTILLLETDCIFGTNWLNKIHKYIQSANGFLVSGATYDGTVIMKSGSPMLTHINGGTALYATGHPLFKHMIEILDTFVAYQVANGMPGIAYDYALKILIDSAIDCHHNDTKQHEIWKFINRNYVPNKLIINCSTSADKNINNDLLVKKYAFSILHKK